MMEGLMENVQSGFDLYKAPMDKMLASYDRMTTDSQLISALATFGRQSAPAGSVAWRMARRGMQASMKIGVQPTAVARRKTPLGGRPALFTGRPTKSSRREHNYGRAKGNSLPKRPAPHSISQCVTDCVAISDCVTVNYRQEFFRLQTCPSNCIECSLIHLFFYYYCSCLNV
ncbi:unnamed protein product [Arctogadus glacialis]